MNKFCFVINFPSNSGNYLRRYYALEDYKTQIYINIIVNINISYLKQRDEIFLCLFFIISINKHSKSIWI